MTKEAGNGRRDVLKAKKKIGFGLQTGALVIAVAATCGAAQPGGPGHRRGPHGLAGFLSPRLLEELNLSESQKQQIRSLREGRPEELVEARREAFEARRALNEAVLQGGDEASLESLAETLGTKEAGLALAEARRLGRILEILTPEQRQRMEELRTEVEARFQERRERFEQRKRPQ